VNGQRWKHHAAPIEQLRQVAPYMTALTEKHRHDGNRITAIGRQMFDGRG
jgi:hypothetical protein